MVIDGRSIAADIESVLKTRIQKSNKIPKLAVIVVSNEYATGKFVALKKKRAEAIGIHIELSNFPSTVDTETLKMSVIEKGNDVSIDGIIVQLPLPRHIETKNILDSIPLAKDIDVLSTRGLNMFKNGTLDIIPPVAGAVREILKRNGVDIKGKYAVVIGKGALVGIPSVYWLKDQGAEVDVVDSSTVNLKEILKNADIIVSGAGVPGLIKPNFIKEGVILLDAGTSEVGGKLSGDADPACAEKCSIFTPVPGGIGPITVAILLSNAVTRVQSTK